MLRTERRLTALAKVFSNELRRELRQEGHYLTGKTAQAVTLKTEQTVSGYRIFMEQTPTIAVLEEGAKYTTKAPPLKVIKEWVEQRGLPRTQSGRTSRSKSLTVLQSQAAFRIRRAILKEGLPTSGSFKYSKNGRRKGFISAALADSYIEQQLDIRGIMQEIVEFSLKSV